MLSALIIIIIINNRGNLQAGFYSSCNDYISLHTQRKSELG